MFITYVAAMPLSSSVLLSLHPQFNSIELTTSPCHKLSSIGHLLFPICSQVIVDGTYWVFKMSRKLWLLLVTENQLVLES